MKKLLFTAYSMDIGGIEKALISLLKRIDYKKYEVTLILEKKSGVFLDELPKNVKVLEYKTNGSANVLFRKIVNRIKLIKWRFKLKNKYDFSCSFATYYKVGGLLALCASKNSALWIHSNYLKFFDDDSKKLVEYFNDINVNKYKKVVFLTDECKNDVLKYYKDINNSFVCGNYIDGDSIIKDSSLYSVKEKYTFVNVGRHNEKSKGLTKLFNAFHKLKSEGYSFNSVFVGDGCDHDKYVKLVHDLSLDDIVTFVGEKKNPYPYMKSADAFVMSSNYEGFAIVFYESMIFNKPIISTKVGSYVDIDKKYGIFDNDIYNALKKYLDNGFEIKKRFDYKKYNIDLDKKIEELIKS